MSKVWTLHKLNVVSFVFSLKTLKLRMSARGILVETTVSKNLNIFYIRILQNIHCYSEHVGVIGRVFSCYIITHILLMYAMTSVFQTAAKRRPSLWLLVTCSGIRSSRSLLVYWQRTEALVSASSSQESGGRLGHRQWLLRLLPGRLQEDGLPWRPYLLCRLWTLR